MLTGTIRAELCYYYHGNRQQQEMLAGELAKNSESFSPKSHSHFVSDEENAQPSDDDLHQLQPKVHFTPDFCRLHSFIKHFLTILSTNMFLVKMPQILTWG